MNKVSGTLYKSTLLSTRMHTHTRKSMEEYKLIKIKKTPIKNGMYFIEKETIGKYSENKDSTIDVLLENIFHCISVAHSNGLNSVSTDNVTLWLKECLKTAENSPIVAETKDGPYIFTTSGWSKVDSFGDVVYDII